MSLKGSRILVTGSAGFIGMHTALALSARGAKVIGLDNLNTYYSVDLKLSRLTEQGIDTAQLQPDKLISGNKGIDFIQLNIADSPAIDRLFQDQQFDYVVHLAAQAGVRYSIENPHAYIDSNVKGFTNIMEACNKHGVKHLVYASSSSVYGLNDAVPFEEKHPTEQQVSLYAATKKANEAIAHSYASVHKLPSTGLRFFTVYGPWGRPDMALFKFTRNILSGKPIDVYNRGNLSRDFTYIDDIVEGIVRVTEHIPHGGIPTTLFNIGKGQPVPLQGFISAIEEATGLKAEQNHLPMQAGDVEKTFASTKKLEEAVGYAPRIELQEGVRHFVEWYRSYYNIDSKLPE